MSKSCKGMLEDMLKYVEETDCVKKNSLKACVKDGALFPSQCSIQREVYLSCKRGQFDMRSRLRGNKGY
jgi:cytochrome c oxidase assembly factor 5